MPPKAKFTREQVAVVALDIVREEGIDALTARNLGARLGMSSRPIFTAFRSMDEVKHAARELAISELKEYASVLDLTDPDIRTVCMLIISYAVHRLELFKLLFMQDSPNGESPNETLARIGELSERCIDRIQREQALSHGQATVVFEQMCVYAFGTGALCAMKLCEYNEDDVRADFDTVYRGLVLAAQSHTDTQATQGKE